MKKTKKALASLAIAGMVLSMAPASVFAADDFVRLAGSDRYQTSIKIAEKAYSDATTAVVAAGNPNNLVDALAAAPLAAQEDAPIYLTDKADMNDDVVKSMKALGVKKVVVVGAAASKAVVDELKAAGFTVDEVKGADRIATAKAINAKLTAPAGTFVVGYDGVADAMSVASYAAANNYAIVVANQSGAVDAGVKADYIVGGTTRVKDIAGAKRLAGADRYDTNKQVIAELDFDFGTVYVGNGLTLADALVGSVLAAQTDSPIALTDGKTVKADIASNLDDDSVLVALGGTAAVSNAVMDAVKNPAPSTGEFKVESVKAAAANAFKVKFTKAPADTEKVTFEVKNVGTAMTTTVNWNEAKTEANLVYSANFPQGDYTVAVKEGTKELGSFELKIEQQKVAKIEVTSDVLSIDITGYNDGTNADAGRGNGYAVYKVLDQYGIDITNLPMANNITWNVGIGELDTAKTRDGLIVIKQGASGLPLLSYPTCVISGYDQSSYVNVNATLSVSQATGTISKMNLKKLYSLTDDAFSIDNRLGGKWYIEYEAFDASGKPTTNYELIKAGVLNVNGGGYVKGEIKQDPKDSKKAVIEVELEQQVDYLNMDVPVTITVILKNGQNATFNTTLTRGKRPDSVTLYAPAETVSSEERFIVPFAVYDQEGKQITSYTDIVNNDAINISVSGGDNRGPNGKDYEWLRNGDGSASLAVYAPKLGPTEKSRSIYVMATVQKTAKNSRINITVQEEAKPYSLSLDSSKLTQAMQKGASQDVELGKALVLKDQYGRNYDLNAQKLYKMDVTGDLNVTDVNDNPLTTLGDGVKKAKLTATATAAVGSKSVKFELYYMNGTERKVIDSKSYSFNVVDNDRITGYTLGELKTLYAVGETDSNGVLKTLTPQNAEYVADLKVFGTLSNGSKVILASTVDGTIKTVQNATVGSDFKANVKANSTVTTVAAIKLSDNKTSASSTVTVVVNGTDGNVYPLTAKVESSTEKPVVKSIGYEADDSKNDRVTIAKSASGQTLNVSKYDSNGAKNGSAAFHFYGEDQYGTKAGNIGVYLGNQDLKVGSTTVKATILGNVLTIPANATGSISLTAVAGGISKTITLEIK
ncbi:cell wall-binding repeat-containing protein [Desulfitobacterium sp. PCE1]|uniref:cell wall-binding repeat-containing protein n=1 Tax=Desulfitobacterium sp. PCE1 TaxID=146907 RepID=UPI00036A6F3B|nr:cell wall-binding repeat-containing protein [Desulfitobacterium sp. PCE1]